MLLNGFWLQVAWWEEAWLRQQPKEKQIDCLRRLLDLSEQEMLLILTEVLGVTTKIEPSLI